MVNRKQFFHDWVGLRQSLRFPTLGSFSRELFAVLAIFLAAGIVSIQSFAAADGAEVSRLPPRITAAPQQSVSSIAAGNIAGKVEGPILDSAGNESIRGWACVVGLGKSISVRLFREGASTDGGFWVGIYPANMPTDARVSEVCEDSGVNHGFSIPIPASLRAKYPGQRLYIDGVDPVTQSHVLLGSDGGTHIYAMTIFRPESYGAQSHSPNTPSKAQDSMPGIQAAITAAQVFISNHTGAHAEVLLSAGEYMVSCHPGQIGIFCLNLNGSQNLIFGGAGLATRIIVQNPMAGGFSALGAPQNVSLVGFAMDYEIPPFTQGTITEVDANGITVELDPGMPLLNRAEYRPNNAVGAFGMVFSPDASHPRLKRDTPNFFLTIPDLKHSHPLENRWRLADTSGGGDQLAAYAAVGDRYVQLARNGIGYGLYFYGGANITIDGVTIYASPDITTLWGGNSGTVTINDLQIRPSPDPVSGTSSVYRAISSNGDGVHFSQNWATPTIKNSYFQGLADDGINVFSVGSVVTPIGSSTTMFSLPGYYVGLVNVGDQLQFVVSATGGLRGQALVSDVVSDPSGVTVTLSSPVPGLAATDVVFDLSADGANAVIKNNIFAENRERGIVCKSPGARISGNSFTDINVQAIALSSILVDGDYEGPNPTNVTISDNSFVGGDANNNGFGQIFIVTPESNYANSNFRETSNITISKNIFTPAKSSGAPPPVYIYSAKNIYLDKDQVVDSSGKKTGLKRGSTVLVTNSTNVQIK